MKTLKLTLFLLTVLGIHTTWAQPTQQTKSQQKAEKIDAIFSDYDNNDTPGCAVGVVQDGDLIFAKGYGMADLEHDVPITSKSAFNVGSVSKQFTAFAVALMADEGKLSLDDIRKWIPEVPDFGHTIKIRHLLHHTSGLRDYEQLLMLTGWPGDGRLTTEELLDFIGRQQALNFEPGSEYLYSNTGYFLSGLIVKRVSGQSLREFAKEHIFDPLEMNHTVFRDDHTMLIEDRALAYAPDPASKAGYRLSMPGSDVVGGTGLYTTLEDLSHWMYNFETQQVGGPQVIHQMLKPGILANGDTLSYALGLSRDTYRGLSVVTHGGSTRGYQSRLLRFPEQKHSVIIICNRRDADPKARALKVVDVFLSEHLEARKEESKKVITKKGDSEINPELLKHYAGTFRVKRDLDAVIQLENADGQLFFVYRNARHPFSSVSDTLFQMSGNGLQVSFHLEPDSSVYKGTLVSTSGKHFMLRRIEAWNPSSEELATYTGKYYSPELKTYYTIVAEDGGLLARLKNNQGGPWLQPMVPDKFAGEFPFESVQFERNGSGEVTAMLVSVGRIRNVRFEKQ